MPVIQSVIEKMQETIPDLPQDWAKRVGDKLGLSPDLVRMYVRGDRGKRNKFQALEILRVMKDLKEEWLEEVNEVVKN